MMTTFRPLSSFVPVNGLLGQAQPSSSLSLASVSTFSSSRPSLNEPSSPKNFLARDTLLRS